MNRRCHRLKHARLMRINSYCVKTVMHKPRVVVLSQNRRNLISFITKLQKIYLFLQARVALQKLYEYHFKRFVSDIFFLYNKLSRF